MSLTRIWLPSPNYSSRGGSGVRLIVLHTTEGAQDIYALGSFFGQSSSQVSSHAGADNKRQGTIGEYVSRGNKAWTQGNANPYCVAMELCTPAGAAAAWSRDFWLGQQEWMLRNAAAWVAEEAGKHGIPLRALTAAEATGGAAGVCEHVDLGSWGGGHSDCGPGFPMDKVMEWAGGADASGPAPPSSSAGGGAAPVLHVDYFSTGHNSACGDVITWQQQMLARGWPLAADGIYGPESERTCISFQQEKGLGVDGCVGPETWSASWTAPVT